MAAITHAEATALRDRPTSPAEGASEHTAPIGVSPSSAPRRASAIASAMYSS